MMVFHNLYILDDEETRSELEEMLLERLKDDQVEVFVLSNQQEKHVWMKLFLIWSNFVRQDFF